MAKTNKKTQTTSLPTQKPKVKVLYQNLGGTWYAFADVNDAIFVGKVNMRAEEASTTAKSKTNKVKEAA